MYHSPFPVPPTPSHSLLHPSSTSLNKYISSSFPAHSSSHIAHVNHHSNSIPKAFFPHPQNGQLHGRHSWNSAASAPGITQRLLTCWQPLRDNDISMGTIAVLQGSHKMPSLHHVQVRWRDGAIWLHDPSTLLPFKQPATWLHMTPVPLAVLSGFHIAPCWPFPGMEGRCRTV